MLEVNDCIRIGGEPVSEEVFAEGIIRAYEASQAMDDSPTEFELLTAAAFLILAEQGCEFAVIECGMGGDGDSTNIIKRPMLSVITNVSTDHCAFLGNTVSDIASHKAGIIKQDVPVFFGGDDRDAFEVIKRVSKSKGSKLYTLQTALFQPVDGDGVGVSYNGREYRVPLSGSYQYKNLVSVLSCVEILRSQGTVIGEDAVTQGLDSVRWEGRFERLCSKPLVIFDGAHNRDGMESLCESIRNYFPEVRPAILIGVLADKDYPAYTGMLKPLVGKVFAVSPDNPRALPSEKLAGCFSSSGLSAEPYPSIHEGFTAAFKYCSDNSLPLLVICIRI